MEAGPTQGSPQVSNVELSTNPSNGKMTVEPWVWVVVVLSLAAIVTIIAIAVKSKNKEKQLENSTMPAKMPATMPAKYAPSWLSKQQVPIIINLPQPSSSTQKINRRGYKLSVRPLGGFKSLNYSGEKPLVLKHFDISPMSHLLLDALLLKRKQIMNDDDIMVFAILQEYFLTLEAEAICTLSDKKKIRESIETMKMINDYLKNHLNLGSYLNFNLRHMEMVNSGNKTLPYGIPCSKHDPKELSVHIKYLQTLKRLNMKSLLTKLSLDDSSSQSGSNNYPSLGEGNYFKLR